MRANYRFPVPATKQWPFLHLVQSALPAQMVHWGTPQWEPHPLQPSESCFGTALSGLGRVMA